ncbi:brachyurin-like [Hyalella azteca]|uniref:Brachyurin-like n=1 Tax=Hyalella azteca TaxID=294128 RepID=A0A8B7NTC3_HYAAZ|nr:brachyurin-like [Hyalella azteca]
MACALVQVMYRSVVQLVTGLRSHDITLAPRRPDVGLDSQPSRLTEANSVAGCGPTKDASRIVGGTEAVPHSFPWQVALFIDDIYFCGGSLISDEWVLTAGHCLHEAQSVVVVAGAHNIREAEPSQVTMTSTNLKVHEDYGPVFLRNDIAILKLPSPITFNEFIAPVCLPTRSDAILPAGTSVTASGWGRIQDDAVNVSDVLNQSTNDVITDDECEVYYGANTINGGVVCTDTTGGHGTCYGDSGGPLNYRTGGVTVTRGVTSFVSDGGCAGGLPDGFTRVLYQLDWIETNTGIIIDN